MSWRDSGLLVLLLVFIAATGAVPPLPAAPEPERAAATTTLAGVIEGTLLLPETPARRTVDRYGASPAAHPVQSIPPIVYLKGSVGGPPPPAGEATMAQRDTAFVPGLLVVPVGTTVRFPNDDAFFHNVFSYSSAARFDLGRYPRGESKEVRFLEPGIVKVYCEVHEPMRAAIVVVENEFWAEPDDDGRFRIEGVPPGSYTIVAWHADQGEVEREVRVEEGGVTRVELEL